jgi:hypothetical protein
VNVDSMLKCVSVCQFLPNSWHVSDPGIKNVIMPMFVLPRPDKWFNNRSLFS